MYVESMEELTLMSQKPLAVVFRWTMKENAKMTKTVVVPRFTNRFAEWITKLTQILVHLVVLTFSRNILESVKKSVFVLKFINQFVVVITIITVICVSFSVKGFPLKITESANQLIVFALKNTDLFVEMTEILIQMNV